MKQRKNKDGFEKNKFQKLNAKKGRQQKVSYGLSISLRERTYKWNPPQL